jgi:hypothetical protein
MYIQVNCFNVHVARSRRVTIIFEAAYGASQTSRPALKESAKSKKESSAMPNREKNKTSSLF